MNYEYRIENIQNNCTYTRKLQSRLKERKKRIAQLKKQMEERLEKGREGGNKKAFAKCDKSLHNISRGGCPRRKLLRALMEEQSEKIDKLNMRYKSSVSKVSVQKKEALDTSHKSFR